MNKLIYQLNKNNKVIFYFSLFFFFLCNTYYKQLNCEKLSFLDNFKKSCSTKIWKALF